MDGSRAAVVRSSMASLGSWLVSWAWMPRTWGSMSGQGARSSITVPRFGSICASVRPRSEDQERLTAWLAESVAQAERRADRVREGLLAKFREERIEPPTTGRVLRMVRSAMRTAVELGGPDRR